ncbi:MAG: carbon-nitrogen hydrolase family protein [Gemmatimonadales bacterium]
MAQTCPVPGNVAANLDQHLALAGMAAAAGAQVVVFPELSLTGYELARAAELAFERLDTRLEPLLALARQARVTLVVGAPVRLEGRLHLGAAVLDADGGLDWYTKRHLGAFGPEALADALDRVLPPPEGSVFAPGAHDPPVHLTRGTARVAICADAQRAEHAAAAATTGAAAYLVGAFIVHSAWEADAAVLRQRAAEHAMLVAMANYGAPSGGMAAAGRSSIWDERGELVLELEPLGAGVGIAMETAEGWKGLVRMVGEGALEGMVERGGLTRGIRSQACLREVVERP